MLKNLLRPRAVAAGLVVLVLVAGTLLALDALTTYRALSAGRADLDAARSAIGAGDLEAAKGHVSAADAQMRRARERTDGPLWLLARWLPLLGRTPEVVARVVDVADAATRVAADAVTEAGPLLEDGFEVRVTDGRVDLSAVGDAGSALRQLPAAELAVAANRLRDTASTWLPAPVRDGRRDALALADGAVRLIDRGGTLTTLLPDLLGEREPRELLLAVQTSAELRGTGGLIGFFSVLTIDDGRFTLSPPVIHEGGGQPDDGPGTEPLTASVGGEDAPVPVPHDFARLYDHVAASSHLSNVNVHPHLPTTGAVLADVFQARTGRSIDGVVLFDSAGMELLLRAIGPVPIPESARVHPDIPAAIPAEKVAEWTAVRVYELLGAGRSADRERFLQAFGISAFQQVFGGSWEGVAVGRAIADATAGRHLQVYSRDPDEQAALTRLGVAGALKAPSGSDLLALTVNNASGGKVDVHVAHRIEGELLLSLDAAGTARRTARLRTSVENPLPATGRDPAIIGSCLLGEPTQACFDGPAGLTRSWFSVWSQQGSDILDGGDPDDAPLLRTGAIDGLEVADVYVEAPAESTGSFDVEVQTEVALRHDGPDRTYRLTWWRQAKAIPDHLDLRLRPPAGWRFTEITLEGGGEPSGMGAGGDGDPVTATIDVGGTSATIRGAITRDLHVSVRLSRSVMDRFGDWLRRPAD